MYEFVNYLIKIMPYFFESLIYQESALSMKTKMKEKLYVHFSMS